MTHDAIKALGDAELTQVIAWANQEIKAREQRRKQEAITKIKALAAQAGVSVSIGNPRGKNGKTKSTLSPNI